MNYHELLATVVKVQIAQNLINNRKQLKKLLKKFKNSDGSLDNYGVLDDLLQPITTIAPTVWNSYNNTEDETSEAYLELEQQLKEILHNQHSMSDESKNNTPHIVFANPSDTIVLDPEKFTDSFDKFEWVPNIGMQTNKEISTQLHKFDQPPFHYLNCNLIDESSILVKQVKADFLNIIQPMSNGVNYFKIKSLKLVACSIKIINNVTGMEGVYNCILPRHVETPIENITKTILTKTALTINGDIIFKDKNGLVVNLNQHELSIEVNALIDNTGTKIRLWPSFVTIGDITVNIQSVEYLGEITY